MSLSNRAGAILGESTPGEIRRYVSQKHHLVVIDQCPTVPFSALILLRKEQLYSPIFKISAFHINGSLEVVGNIAILN